MRLVVRARSGQRRVVQVSLPARHDPAPMATVNLPPDDEDDGNGMFSGGGPQVDPGHIDRGRPRVRVRRTTVNVVELGAVEVVDLLRAAGYRVAYNEGGARVTFRVPGGGDWSNTDVDLAQSSAQRPTSSADTALLRVEWTDSEES